MPQLEPLDLELPRKILQPLSFGCEFAEPGLGDSGLLGATGLLLVDLIGAPHRDARRLLRPLYLPLGVHDILVRLGDLEDVLAECVHLLPFFFRRSESEVLVLQATDKLLLQGRSRLHVLADCRQLRPEPLIRVVLRPHGLEGPELLSEVDLVFHQLLLVFVVELLCDLVQELRPRGGLILEVAFAIIALVEPHGPVLDARVVLLHLIVQFQICLGLAQLGLDAFHLLGVVLNGRRLRIPHVTERLCYGALAALLL